MDSLRDWFSRRCGTGGSPNPFEVVTSGRKRFSFGALQPAITGEAAETDPDAPRGVGVGTFYFRDRGDGKAQLCVRFPSGAIQILATEP